MHSPRLPGTPGEPACPLPLDLVDGSPQERGIFPLVLQDLLGKALTLFSPADGLAGWRLRQGGGTLLSREWRDNIWASGQENKEEKKGVGSLTTKATSPSVLRSLSLKTGGGRQWASIHNILPQPCSHASSNSSSPYRTSSQRRLGKGGLQIWQVCSYLGGKDGHYHLPQAFTTAPSSLSQP